ncbi:MAG: hypothetical protein IKP58_17285 [Victivallales bacterium]|nr:hypothetical protein [Victivallales bacterium]
MILSDAMKHQFPTVFRVLFNELLARCPALVSDHSFHFHNKLYAFDNMTIPCASLTTTARYRANKGAV